LRVVVVVGEMDLGEHHIGGAAAHDGVYLGPGTGGTDHVEVGAGGQRFGERLRHHVVVVDDENGDGARFHWPRC
jgi:hypothetical protein